MTLKEFMERLNRTDQSRVISQLKDGIEEMNMTAEVDIARINIDITKDKRYYNLPPNCGRIINIKAKNQDNEKDLYGHLYFLWKLL